LDSWRAGGDGQSVASSFDAIDHGWLVKFVEHRIADRRVVRLIQKWLNAGVLEEGTRTRSEEGTPQGGSASPLLANIYLHYVFDLWVQQWRTTRARGDVIVVRYADDLIVGFQHKSEAERFLAELKERFRKFHLELHPDKTRLLEFGPFAAENRRRGGRGKPETFKFLGFTHICGKKRSGRFTVLRQTMRNRLQAKLSAVKAELRQRWHAPIPVVGQWLRAVVGGLLQAENRRVVRDDRLVRLADLGQRELDRVDERRQAAPQRFHEAGLVGIAAFAGRFGLRRHSRSSSASCAVYTRCLYWITN
jgi:RNA-directed DNA polymerase